MKKPTLLYISLFILFALSTSGAKQHDDVTMIVVKVL
jgi:hypothetical protein